MPHEICKKSYVIEAFKEVLGKTMTERMRIYHVLVHSIFLRKMLQSLSDATCCNAFSKMI